MNELTNRFATLNLHNNHLNSNLRAVSKEDISEEDLKDSAPNLPTRPHPNANIENRINRICLELSTSATSFGIPNGNKRN